MLQQLSLLGNIVSPNSKIDIRSGTFLDNMKLPIHRWFRYSAGFSAEWVESVIQEFKPSLVLDPFAGSGTTLLAAERCNVKSFGFESHPFVSRIAKAKLQWHVPINNLISASRLLIKEAQKIKIDTSCASPLLHKCYEPETLKALFSLRESYLKISPTIDASIGEILWLAITSILRVCSHVGTAQWQYLLPNKKKRVVQSPYLAFELKISEMVSDIEIFHASRCSSRAEVIQHDARLTYEGLRGQVDLVVTSPPYPNNYDYADATRLEMCFWGEIEKWGDLQQAVRKYIIRSCSQHAAAEKLKLEDLLNEPLLAPIYEDLSKVCHELEVVRHSHGGKKAYHLMVGAYFVDLSKNLKALRDLCKSGANMCFVIGDSAPYGVYVPVDEFLERIALSVGFASCSFEKIRDRNIKWKNRKHRVPLQEGRLWIKG